MKLNPITTAIAIVCVLAIFAGCSPATAPDNSAPEQAAPKEDESSQAETPSAAAEETIKWNMPCSMGPGTIWWDENILIAQMMEELSGGRFIIEPFAPGALVEAFEALPSVMEGSNPCCCSWAGYVSGMNFAFNAIDSVDAGMNNWDLLNWYYQGGGKKMVMDLWAQYGVVGFVNYQNCHEQGFLTSKPIKKLNDFKGLKLRTSGVGTRMLIEEFGGSAINMPGGEVYEALKRGVIDGLEMGTVWPDYQMGLWEVSKYWSVPIWHQRGSMHHFVVNEKAFNDLPDQYKAMLEYACDASTLRGSTEQEYMSAEGTRLFLEHCEQVELDDAVVQQIEEMILEIKHQLAEESPEYEAILQSMQDYLDYIDVWKDTIKPYGHGDTPRVF
jgi:TRAP-type mannitol/chloroaromatic compound transport system substrate-binding protein